MLAPVRVTAPAIDIIAIDDVMAHCRVDSADEVILLQSLTDAATSHVDGYSGILGRALIQQEWQQDFSGFGDVMRLPLGPLIAVSSVTYYDTSNVLRTLSAAVYAAYSDGRGPYIALAPDQVWPATYSRPDAVRATWTAGYGTTADTVPAAIRAAVKLMIGHWYENREAAVIGAPVASLPMAVDALLSPFRRVEF